jgi:two-component system, response regulator PdtaR
MNRCLRIIVADDDAGMLLYYREELIAMGHEVIAAVQNGRELVEQCRTLKPDLVITDIKMPEMDGLHAAAEISRQQLIPIIVVSADNDRELIERAEKNGVQAFLVKPIKQSDLAPTVAIALRKFNDYQALCKESAELRQALEERKIIERAKGILMKTASLNETQALNRLEELANVKAQKTSEIAEMIVAADEVFQTATKLQSGNSSGAPHRKSRNGRHSPRKTSGTAADLVAYKGTSGR